MKNFKSLTIYALLALGVAAVSCESDDTTSTATGSDYTDVLTSYTNNTVISTYSNMATAAIALNEVVAGLDAEMTDADVAAAAEAWINTRQYWEQSEAFLFGPASYNNLDPKLDSWPLDLNKLNQELAIIADETQEPTAATIDADYVNDNYGYTLQGFHAVEYMLFSEGAARTADSYTDSELAYLKAIAEVLMGDCITLEGWWTGGSNLSSEKQDILGDEAVEGLTAFGEEIINSGNVGSRYASQDAAIEEMIDGAKAIADEVGNAKIAEPVESGDVLTVESWYSYNSITDFVNNINSIDHMYAEISALVAEENATLDSELQAAIDDAKVKIEAIGSPFRDNLDNTEGAAAATAACVLIDDKLSEVKVALFD